MPDNPERRQMQVKVVWSSHFGGRAKGPENAGRKAAVDKKQGQTDIEDAVAALKRQAARSN